MHVFKNILVIKKIFFKYTDDEHREPYSLVVQISFEAGINDEIGSPSGNVS